MVKEKFISILTAKIFTLILQKGKLNTFIYYFDQRNIPQCIVTIIRRAGTLTLEVIGANRLEDEQQRSSTMYSVLVIDVRFF